MTSKFTNVSILMKYGLSLIIACYNEEPHLFSSYKKIARKLKKCQIPYEIIFVEDKSVDNTKDIIKSILKKDKLAKAIFHKKNIGRGGSVADGILKAKYEYVGFIDVDLEISENYIDLFINELRYGADIAIALREYPFALKSLHRTIASKGYIYLEKLFLNIPFHDTEAGYKFFKKSKIIPILKRIKNKGWFWDTEIVARSYYSNLIIKEIPVAFVRRIDKKSTVKIFSDSIDYFMNLVKFRLATSKDFKNHSDYWKSSPEKFNHSYTNKKNFLYFVHSFLNIRMNKVLSFLKNVSVKRKKILDVGCGGGQYMEYFLKKDGKVIGIDYSQKMINLANEYLTGKGYKNYSLLKADAKALPFDNNSFDLVMGIGLLEYLTNPEVAIAEISRVLKYEGNAVLSFSKKQSPFFFIRIFPGIILRKRLLNLPKLITTFSSEDIHMLLGKNKLEIKKIDQVFLTEYLILCQKNKSS